MNAMSKEIKTIEMLAYELEERFSEADGNTVKAILDVCAPMGSTTHYIYDYDGCDNGKVYYKALYTCGNDVISGRVNMAMGCEEEFSFLMYSPLINKSVKEVSWVLELEIIQEKAGHLIAAIYAGASTSGEGY